mmetsp:Transcript_69217/g.102914  ORF Transcript_69217/g.102914 Transcript_69217/m.102914 type:complete len:353 (+) Transcript_69217:1209-2267(+)
MYSESVKHVHEILSLYCARQRVKQQRDENSLDENNDSVKDHHARSGSSDDDDDPSMEEIADWILASFTAVVLTNGIDFVSKNKHPFPVELSLTCIFFNFSVSSPMCSKLKHNFAKDSSSSLMNHDGTTQTKEISNAVQKRIYDLLSPPLIDKLSALHLLALARLFLCIHLYHEEGNVGSDEVKMEDFIVHSIVACANECGGVGLSILPKLIATYISFIIHLDDDVKNGNNDCDAGDNNAAVEDSSDPDKVKSETESETKSKRETVISTFERRVRRGVLQYVTESSRRRKSKQGVRHGDLSQLQNEEGKKIENMNAEEETKYARHRALDLWELILQSTIYLLSSTEKDLPVVI